MHEESHALDRWAPEFRELVCTRAVEFENKEIQAAAIRIIVDRNFVDERFNAPVYDSLKSLTREDQWNNETAFDLTQPATVFNSGRQNKSSIADQML